MGVTEAHAPEHLLEAEDVAKDGSLQKPTPTTSRLTGSGGLKTIPGSSTAPFI